MVCQPAPDEVRIYYTFLIDIFRDIFVSMSGGSRAFIYRAGKRAHKALIDV